MLGIKDSGIYLKAFVLGELFCKVSHLKLFLTLLHKK